MERTLSNVLHCVGVYCKSSYDLEYGSQIGDGQITMFGDLFATYDWKENEDSPKFIFHQDYPFYRNHYPLIDNTGPKVAKKFTKNQFVKRPYIEDRNVLFQIDYVIQEIPEDITFEDAKILKFTRDKTQNWEQTSLLQIQSKIEESMSRHSHDYINKEKYPDIWKHLALCVIYDL